MKRLKLPAYDLWTKDIGERKSRWKTDSIKNYIGYATGRAIAAPCNRLKTKMPSRIYETWLG